MNHAQIQSLSDTLRNSIPEGKDSGHRLLDAQGLVVVRRGDLEALLDVLTQEAGRIATMDGMPDLILDRIVKAASDVLVERSRYFERTTGHYDREQAAGSYRASVKEVERAILKAAALPVESDEPDQGEPDAWMGIDEKGEAQPFALLSDARIWANVGEAPGGSVHGLRYIEPPQGL